MSRTSVDDVLVLLAAPPAPATSNTLLYLFAAMLAGGLVGVGWNAYQRWAHGGRDDALKIAEAAREQATHSSELWTKYRVELEDAKQQMAEYLRELVKVNRELGESSARISALEDQLRTAHGERDELLAQLADARARRDQLTQRVEELERRIEALTTELRTDSTTDGATD